MSKNAEIAANLDAIEPPTIISLKGTGIEGMPYGVHGMAIGPDGYTLVITTPMTPGLFGLAHGKPKGNVLIFDLRTLNMQTGKIEAPVAASMPSDGISGKGPGRIQQGLIADRAGKSKLTFKARRFQRHHTWQRKHIV